jgi:hypothetical protein
LLEPAVAVIVVKLLLTTQAFAGSGGAH